MLRKKTPALRKCHRMRVDALHFRDIAVRDPNHVMLDADHRFTFDEHRVFAQQVIMFDHRSRERVFDRNHDRVYLALAQTVERIGGKNTGNDGGIRNGAKRGLVAERAKLALDSYLHDSQTWIYLCRYGNSCFVKRTIPYRSAHICGEIDTNALDNLRSIAGAVAAGLRRLPCTGSIYSYSAFDRLGGTHSAACRRPSNGRLEWIFHRSTPQQGRRTRLLH